jgi:hypothetical protein
VLGQLPDSTRVIQGEHGHKEFHHPDGKITTQDASGNTVLERLVDGTTIESMPNGVIKQTLANGQVNIHFTTTNVRVQINGTVKITHMPGCVMQEDSALGYRAMRFPDGYELVETGDGSSIDIAPSGETKVTKKDGTIIETFEDGSKRVTQPDGDVRSVPPPPPEVS